MEPTASPQSAAEAVRRAYESLPESEKVKIAQAGARSAQSDQLFRRWFEATGMSAQGFDMEKIAERKYPMIRQRLDRALMDPGHEPLLKDLIWEYLSGDDEVVEKTMAWLEENPDETDISNAPFELSANPQFELIFAAIRGGWLEEREAAAVAPAPEAPAPVPEPETTYVSAPEPEPSSPQLELEQPAAEEEKKEEPAFDPVPVDASQTHASPVDSFSPIVTAPGFKAEENSEQAPEAQETPAAESKEPAPETLAFTPLARQDLESVEQEAATEEPAPKDPVEASTSAPTEIVEAPVEQPSEPAPVADAPEEKPAAAEEPAPAISAFQPTEAKEEPQPAPEPEPESESQPAPHLSLGQVQLPITSSVREPEPAPQPSTPFQVEEPIPFTPAAANPEPTPAPEPAPEPQRPAAEVPNSQPIEPFRTTISPASATPISHQAAPVAPLALSAQVEELQRYCDQMEAQLKLLRKASREANVDTVRKNSELAEDAARKVWTALENLGHYTPTWKTPEELQLFVNALSSSSHSWGRGLIDFLQTHKVVHRLEMVRDKWEDIRLQGVAELNRFMTRAESAGQYPGPKVDAAQWWSWATNLGDVEFQEVYQFCAREHLPSLIELLSENPKLEAVPRTQGYSVPPVTKPATPTFPTSSPPQQTAASLQPAPTPAPSKADDLRAREQSILDRVGIKLPDNKMNGHG